MKTVVLFGFVLGALSAAGRVIVTKPGLTVTLDCGVSSYNKKVEWHRDSNVLRSAAKMRGIYPVKGKSELAERSSIIRETRLRISGVKVEDAGKFTVVVDGKPEDVILVVVSVSASPSTDLQLGSEVTLRCQIKGLNPEPAVQWVRPDGNQGQTGSEVQLKPVARSDGGTWICKFSHDDGPHEETLEIKVQEPPTTAAPARDPSQKKDTPKTNCSGCAPPKSPPKAGQLLGLSWWMWVIVGVGSLVVVLLLVLVICLYKRIKRKKRKLQKLKNSRLPPLTTKPYCQCDRPTAAAKPQQGRRREKPSAPPLQPLLIE